MTISEILNKIDERKNYINNWIENPEPDEWHFLEELQTDLSAISERSESLAKEETTGELNGFPAEDDICFTLDDLKKHDKEIAEQIIEDISEGFIANAHINSQGYIWIENTALKDQLRKKYLNN